VVPTATQLDPDAFSPTVDAHTYTLRVTDEGYKTASSDNSVCFADEISNTFDVHAQPLDKTVTVDDTYLCYETSTNINIAATQNNVRYDILFNGVATALSINGNGGAQSISTGDLLANTTVTVTATNTATTPACTFDLTDSHLITVNPVINITASVDDSEVCLGEDITLSSAPTGGSGTYNFAWSSGTDVNYTDPTVENPAAYTTATTVFTANNYEVLLTDQGFLTASTGGGDATTCTATTDVDVTINDNPTTSITASDGICTNISIPLTGGATAGSGALATHAWTGANLTPLSATNVENPTFETDIPLAYLLTYTVTDVNGCSATDNTTITVSGPVVDILAD
jgi:hypothetical protein